MTRKQIVSLAIGGFIFLTVLFLGTDLAIFINPLGLLLVVGGTLGGVFVAFPLATLAELWQQLKELGKPRVLGYERLSAILVELARLQKREGVRVLEERARQSGSQFLAMGVAMVADERPVEEIRERLEQEFDFIASRREAQRAVLGLMGRLAPAFGLAGTMMGLIRMLHTLKDPSVVSEGMSMALLTTFYGIMLANLLVLPLERKLNERSRAEAVELSLITEGIIGLAKEENGAAIQARLASFRHLAPPEAGAASLTGFWRELKHLAHPARRIENER